MFENTRRDLNELAMPVSITPRIDGDFITFKKGDMNICKFNREDIDALHNAHILLSGLFKGKFRFEEIEQLRDLILEVVGS